jgi:hypothetical protein
MVFQFQNETSSMEEWPALGEIGPVPVRILKKRFLALVDFSQSQVS